MAKLPGLVFVVDAKKEEIAVRESNRLGIPVIAIADTNADPDLLTIAIAGNDDAIRSVSLITGTIADAIEAAKRERPEVRTEDEGGEAYTYSSDAGDVEDAGSAAAKRKKRPRRRPRPEAIAQRLHQTEGEAAEPKGDEASDAGEPAGGGKSEGEDATADAGEREPVAVADAVSEDAEDGASAGT